MRSNKRQQQKIWFSTISSENVSGIDTVPAYSAPEMYKMTVSDTSGTSEETSAGLIPNYDRYITQWKSRWNSFEPKEGMVCWIDVRPQLKANGELNAKYPGGIEAQKEMLEKEGHIVIQKGRTNIKYYVKDYEKALFTLK